MTIQHIEAKTCYSILNDHYSEIKNSFGVFRFSGTSATWAFFSCKNEAPIIQEKKKSFDFESILLNYEPLSVFESGVGMVCNGTREGAEIYMFVEYII